MDDIYEIIKTKFESTNTYRDIMGVPQPMSQEKRKKARAKRKKKKHTKKVFTAIALCLMCAVSFASNKATSYLTDTVYVYVTDTVYEYVTDTVYEYVIEVIYDVIYLEADGTALTYSLAEHGITYSSGRIVNTNGIAIKLYSSDGKLVAASDTDISMANKPTGFYIVTDGSGGFYKFVY